MAKQVGPLFFTGTIDGLIFYKLGDKYYTRSKGSYKSAKHMRRNPRYQRTMEKATQFGEASKLAKEVYYWYLPKDVRKHGFYGKLTGMANSLLQKGKGKEEVRETLLAYCQNLVYTLSKPTATSIVAKPATKTSIKPSIDKPLQGSRKRARYLSRWTVKANGLLQLPEGVSSTPVHGDGYKAIHKNYGHEAMLKKVCQQQLNE